MFSIIAAIGRSNELGKDNDLLFHLPSDMKFFREKTSGHTIVMGHRTFISLGGVLPNRHHVVITHDDPAEFPEGVEVVHSFAEFMRKYAGSDEEIFIIGGGEIYRLFYSYVTKMYITHINAIRFNADTFFPKINDSDWNIKVLKEFEEEGHQACIKEYTKK